MPDQELNQQPSEASTKVRKILDTTNAEHRNDIDDLENREINAGEIYGVCPKWAHGVGTRSGVEEAS